MLLLFSLSLQAADYYTGENNVLLPDPQVTPGKADPKVKQSNIKQAICRPNYTLQVRHVTDATKKQVMEEYGLNPEDSGKYEIDHLISLELGGSNDISNLWPQPYETHDSPPGAHAKDILENALHRKVCSGEVPLKEAQSCIATNWAICAREHVAQ